ncbi:hypothetical protein FGG08_005247 [Glutinoglossum americanum]|uniref:Uncharacterized protein n=1 Tax=Glutinoglossum americanum TaxID=1670608 RepID=A0A9P8L325_9PEZI|nr:hypothetical protein FGG08_005247 [Glutinoglossum americanum]
MACSATPQPEHAGSSLAGAVPRNSTWSNRGGSGTPVYVRSNSIRSDQNSEARVHKDEGGNRGFLINLVREGVFSVTEMASRFKKLLLPRKGSRKDNPLHIETGSPVASSITPPEAVDSTPQPKQQRANVETAATQSEQQIAIATQAPRQPAPCADERLTAGLSGTGAETAHPKTSREQVLYQPANASETLVDIIFVHGLTGDSYNTWLEAESGTYWPVHLLCQSVPDARTMAFGYDADVAKFLRPVSQSNLRDHASTLLGDLADKRIGAESPLSNQRKIVFMVHSLGGLVLKKALCMSESSVEPDLKQADSCTIAVAFLGTPHRGSGLAPFAKVVASILKIGGKRVNKGILGVLERDSEVLADVEGSFGIWLRKKSNGFNITCFYEELELPGVGLVVTKDSAQISGYPQMSIHANHIGMTKFKNSDDTGYTRIIGTIERWLGPLKAQAGQDMFTPPKIGFLSFMEMNDRGNDIEPAADGTCAWLLQHHIYKDWLSQRRGLLWVKGNPGAGKSTVLKYALQAMEQDEPLPPNKLVTLSFFFHCRGAEIQRTPLGLFRSLLHQLLGRFPGPPADVVQTFKDRSQSMGKPGEKWNRRPQELQGFVETSLPKILVESSIRIFVDALDECGEEAAIRLVKYFQHLLSKCSSAQHRLSICFSCRHFPIVSLDNGLEICIERENRQDIRRYIWDELKDVIHGNELKVLQDKILHRSSGIFQWVALIVPTALRLHRQGRNAKAIEKSIQEVPKGLDSLYREILKSIDGEDLPQSLQLMQWICFAQRPLSLEELRFAMVVDADTPYSSLGECRDSADYTETDEAMEKRMGSLSGGLVEVKEHQNRRVAQFIHQSVNDYLIRDGLQQLEGCLTSSGIGRARFRLSRSCIRYLTMEEVLCNSSKVAEDLEHEFPLLQYATTNWVSHAEIVETEEISQGDLLGLLKWPSNQILQSWARVYKIMEPRSDRLPATNTTILHLASRYDLLSVITAAVRLKDKPDVDSKDEYGWTPLSWAAKNGHEAVVKLLLDTGKVDVDLKDRYGRTPLSWAARDGREAVVKLLLDTGKVDMSSEDKNGRTPLSWAAGNGHKAVVKLLYDTGKVDVDSKDKNGRTPLSWAAEKGRRAVVRLLVDTGKVDVDSKDKSGRTPLLWAVENGHMLVVSILDPHTPHTPPRVSVEQQRMFSGRAAAAIAFAVVVTATAIIVDFVTAAIVH